MSDQSNRLDSSRKPTALRTLLDQLVSLNTGNEPALAKEVDMLSLIVDGALNGENIAQRYPMFYQKLLENAGLRQAFLEALESVEAERFGALLPIPGGPSTSLDFLTRQRSEAVIETGQQNGWRATWQRTLEQLQAIFSPPEVAYRASQADVTDPWFTLLRDEMTAAGVTYDILLDCTLSTEHDASLAAFLTLAVTLGNTGTLARFPLRANLEWGHYQGSALVTEEGRFPLPDIPVDSVFDETGSQLQAGFSLSLEAVA
jgi:hypothetical protein